MSASAIWPASTIGLCSVSVWQSARKRMLLVRCDISANSWRGSVMIANCSNHWCSRQVNTSKPS